MIIVKTAKVNTTKVFMYCWSCIKYGIKNVDMVSSVAKEVL